jgi:hypothetical protein
MIKILIGVALCVTIVAGSTLLYRNQPYSIRFEREEPPKSQERPVTTPPVFPVPHLAPAPVVPAPAPAPASIPAPAREEPRAVAPAPVKKMVKHKAKPKGPASTKLRKDWVRR